MFVFLKCVLMSRWRFVLNLPPFRMFKSKNSMRSLLMLHVNLWVLCAVLSLARKLSSSFPVSVQMHIMLSM